MTYNSRRSILGAIPLNRTIAYHLFKINTGSLKTQEIVRLLQKSKWSLPKGYLGICDVIHHEDSSFHNIGCTVTGFDFDPSGERAATISSSGVCLVLDIDTSNCKLHLTIGEQGISLFETFFSIS